MFWLDCTILGLLALGAVLGAMSGFLWQIARIVGLALSLYATVLLNDWAAAQFQGAWLSGADPRIAQALAYVAVFITVYLVLYQIVWLLDRAIRAVNLEPIDRLLGALVGACKIALILAAICLGLTAYPNPQTKEVIDKSSLAPALAEGMEVVLMVIPEEYKTELCDRLKSIRDLARAKVAPTPPAEATPLPDKSSPNRDPPRQTPTANKIGDPHFGSRNQFE